MAKHYYRDDYSTIDFDHMVPCIIHKAKGMAHHSEHYQFVQERLAELLTSQLDLYNRLHMLIDSSEAGPISSRDIGYYRTTMLPLIHSKGVRYVAFIPPQKKIAGIILNELFKNNEYPNLIVKEFDTTKLARKWLKDISRK